MAAGNRRRFLERLAAGAIAAAGTEVATAGASEPRKVQSSRKKAPKDPNLTDRVAKAMLSMQRAAWEQGVAAQAFLERGDMDMVVLFAREAALRQSEDGRLANVAEPDNVTDAACNGEAVLRAAQHTGEAALQRASDRMLEYLLTRAPRASDGTLYHLSNKPEIWVDSIYMAPPFLAVAGRPEQAWQQVEGMRRRLWNDEARLFSHIWDEREQKFVRRALWGVGNGWAAAGMIRVRAALPPSMEKERRSLEGYVRDVIDGCLVHQRADGLFHDVLDDPSSFVETNIAQMLAYCCLRGQREGWLEPRYRRAGIKLRDAALAKVDAEGYVRDVCGAPSFDRPGTATEGQAFCLMMEAELARA